MNESMFDGTFDPKSLFKVYRHAFAPVLQAQQEGLKAFDRLGRYQYAVVGDCLEWSVAQAKAVVEATTPDEFFSKQGEINTALSAKLRTRAQELATLASDTQAGMTQVASDATAKVAGMTKETTAKSEEAVKATLKSVADAGGKRAPA